MTTTRSSIPLLRSDGQGGYAKGERANLAEKDRRSGQYLRNILKSIPASAIGVQPARFLFD